MRFTAEEAFDASADGEPILVEEAAGQAILALHDIDESWADYLAAMKTQGRDPSDAAHLLCWLGY